MPPIDVDVTKIDEDKVLLAGEFNKEGKWAADDFNWFWLLLVLVLVLFKMWFVSLCVVSKVGEDDLLLLEKEELDILEEDILTLIDDDEDIGCLKLTAWKSFWAVLAVVSKSSSVIFVFFF